MAARSFSNNPQLRRLDDSIKKYHQYQDERSAKLPDHEKNPESGKERNECLTLMKEIFEWRDWFVKTDTFKLLARIPNWPYPLFEGDWGHNGAWERQNNQQSLIEINPLGDLSYNHFSQHGSGRIDLPDPNTAASCLTLKFVKTLHGHIMTGKAYDSLKADIDILLEAAIETDKMCENGMIPPNPQ